MFIMSSEMCLFYCPLYSRVFVWQGISSPYRWSNDQSDCCENSICQAASCLQPERKLLFCLPYPCRVRRPEPGVTFVRRWQIDTLPIWWSLMNQALNGLKLRPYSNFRKGNRSTAKMAVLGTWTEASPQQVETFWGPGFLTVSWPATRAVCRHPCKCKRQRPSRLGVAGAAFFDSWSLVKKKIYTYLYIYIYTRKTWNKAWFLRSLSHVLVTFPGTLWPYEIIPSTAVRPPGDSVLHATRQQSLQLDDFEMAIKNCETVISNVIVAAWSSESSCLPSVPNQSKSWVSRVFKGFKICINICMNLCINISCH